MKKKLLLVGGAGYIGNSIIKHFLKLDYEISIVDNLIYYQKFKYKNKVNFFKGDFLNLLKMKNFINQQDYVVFLAGLVGDPITKKYPKLSKKTNYKNSKIFIKYLLKQNVKKFIFISTCSNYGMVSSKKKAKENEVLKPLSLYAKDKVAIEKYILGFKFKTKSEVIILRFATAFGVSDRMRFDLTINEFTRDLLFFKKLKVYDADTWRPYCHVKDFAITIEKIINIKKKLNFQIFNVGSDKNNYTKRQISQKIKKILKIGKITFQENSNDPRNYKVNFDKIKKVINFQPNHSVNYGIMETIKYLKKFYVKKKNYTKKMGNYFIK